MKKNPYLLLLICGLLFLTTLSFAQEITPETKKPFAYYKIIGERNLFKPFKAEAGPEEMKGKEGLANLILTGIIFENEEGRIIVEDRSTGKSIWLKKGEEIGGAKLVDILKDKAIFLKNSNKVELVLKKEEKPAGIRRPGRKPPVSPSRRRPSRRRTIPRRRIPREQSPPPPPPELPPR
jgi:type II secretory pathway component PulC